MHGQTSVDGMFFAQWQRIICRYRVIALPPRGVRGVFMSEILLEISHLRKSFADRELLDIDHIAIYEGERIGLIGENGAGKSTLLSLLSGDMTADAGKIHRRCTVALIRQYGQTDMQANGQLQSEFAAPAMREGLSGGEQTRRRIAAALSCGAHLLLADEPTTDLDTTGIALVRQHLATHHGALLLVSHDRVLLEALCTRIWHLEDGHISDFPGSYSAYQAELARRREYQQFEYDQYRAEKARLKAAAQRKAEWAASVRKTPKRMGISEARLHTREYTNAVLAQSHAARTLQDRMERLERKERPRDLPQIRMALGASHPIQSKTALTVRGLTLKVGRRTLLSGASFVLPTQSRTALIGDNGCGKTTLLRALKGEALVDYKGDIRFNPGARVGWFDQDHAQSLDFARTVLDNVQRDAMCDESTARTVLARLNLRGDDVFKKVGILSGGERAKAAMAKLLLSDINLLVLDEPTNHLDLFTLEALETLLANYGGTLLFVSHDAAFVRAVATRMLRFEGNSLTTFNGTLTQWEDRQKLDSDREAANLEICRLEMRMAVLAARMSVPKKGDHPEDLNAQYEELAGELRNLKRRTNAP